MDLPIKLHSWENGKSNFKSHFYNGDNGQTESLKCMVKSIVVWLNEQLPNLNLAVDVSLETLRACFLDGFILCQLLNVLSPGAIEMDISSQPNSAYVEKFLSALDKMGFLGFEVSNLEQGSMITVLECLRELKNNFNCNAEREIAHNHARKRWNLQEIECLNGNDNSQMDNQQSTEAGLDLQRHSQDSKLQTVLQSNGLSGNLGPNVNVPELMKLNNLDKAPTQFLFSMVDKVLDEGLERKNANVPNRLADLLKGIVLEIEHRMSNQADKIKSQNNQCKVRGAKYRSRVKALETLAVGAAEESEAVLNHLQRIKIEKAELEDKKMCNEQNVIKLMKERDECCAEIGALKQELEESKMCYEKWHVDMEREANQMKAKLEEKINKFEHLLGDSKKKVKELEEKSEHKIQKLRNRELRYHYFVDSQSATLQGLRADLGSVKREMLNTQECYLHEFHHLDNKLKELVDAAESYHMVLAENRKLYNEVQDLKGNIRVYSRIRPFLSGQNHKQTTIEYIGENGELVVVNPVKQGKDSRRLFKFNKVFAPTASQEEVFIDTQPLIRSVLDGYNVCIFAYGQTGSGKTYTMTGPDMTSQKDWGVNYRALHDLFQISQNRRSSILYDVDVQMIEIYNEQVRDLLICDGSQKRLGIRSTAQPNGLAVPGASLHPVKSTNDVLELMNIGFMNRAVGATALNERSSRSHSILTVHVRGMDLKSNSVMRGCLHLVDLAGSERVDRSEARGDRLKEAQHINKSLSALGDVIFALAQKNSHVPYRNSKLTQVLQSSLGGQAKTLMFVQLNPDVESYSETISTLKFAERVSGVELGAARSNKEGKNIRELMEQVSFLKDTVVKKDEEIERLRTAKANMNGENRVVNALKKSFFSPKNPDKLSFDEDYFSEHGDRLSGGGSQPSVVELKPEKDILSHKNLSKSNGGEKFNDDTDLLGFGDADSEERLSDISDGGISMGTETDGSVSSVVEYTLFPDVARPAKNLDESNASSKTPKLLPKQQTGPSRLSLNKAFSKAVSSTKKVVPTSSSSIKPKLRPPKRSQ